MIKKNNTSLIQIVSSKPINSYGTTQIRCLQTAEYLQAYGYSVSVEQIYKATPIKSGIIFVHRIILDKFTDTFLTLAKIRKNIIIYDTDDLIYRFNSKIKTTVNEDELNQSAWLRGLAMLKCDVVTVGTDYLANRAKALHKDVRIIRNALSNGFLFKARKIYAQRNKIVQRDFTIGYFSGSKTHDRDFQLVEKTLIKLLKERKNVRVLLAGKLSFSEYFYKFGNRFNYVTFCPYNEFANLFKKIDINLIPLDIADEFCQGKSELKYIEAGACGVVSVASATHTYKNVIASETNGIIVESDEWYEVLLKLIDEPALIKLLANNAFQSVVKNYNPDRRARELNEMLSDIKANYSKNRINNCSNSRDLIYRIELKRQWLQIKLRRFFKRNIMIHALKSS